jgi:hypothetical protein
MPTIMEMYNTGLAAREQQTRNKYLDPALAAQTSIAQTQAQYLPDQYKLANQYQGLINQYYGPNITSQINERNINSKYKPLEVGISLQNSLRNSSRFGDAANVVRSINSMNSADQTLYLSDPNNLAAYTSALKQIQQGVTNGTPSNQVLTPDFMRQFGFNVGGGAGGGAGLAANPAMPPAQPAPQVTPPEPQQMPSQQPSAGMATPVAPMQPDQQPPPEAAPTTATIPGVGAVQMPPASQPSGMATPVVQPPQQAPAEAHPAVQKAVEQHIAENAPNQVLPLQDRMVLARQAMANQKLAGAPLWNRAQGAVILEKYLQDNQDVFAPRLKNAAEYAGALGKSKLLADKLAAQSPQKLIDYQWVTKDFIPNLGNNVKVMEKLASTDEQRKVLNDMQMGALSWYVDPQASIKLLNMNMDLFHRQAKSIFAAAQPMFPGALEKLNGIKEPSGGYIKQDIKKMSTADLLKMYKESSNG